MAESVESVLVVENNTGQMYPYIKSEAAHACRVEFLGPEILGQIHEPEYIVSYIKEMIG
jgi:2-oxoglutarate ferredoxin oxidoreductase subunit alpha